MRLAAIFLTLLLTLVLPAHAAGEGGKGPVNNPFHEEIRMLSLDMAKSFDKEQTMALVRIRNGFGMIRAVKTVEQDVGKAVGACMSKHDGMKEDIGPRFDRWQGKINPLIGGNEKTMNTIIDSALYDDQDRTKIRAYLSLIDKAAAHADSKLDKNIASTLESCQALNKSLDNTEKAVMNILGDIKWPELPKEENGKKQ